MTEKKKTPGKAKGKKAARKPPAKKAAKKTPPKKAARKAIKKAPVKTPKSKRPALQKAPPRHWLVRPETIRKLWIVGGVTLAALVAIEAGVQTYGYFGLDGTFAFNAWYGFAVCVAMIVAAKGLGLFLKREDTYYDVD